VALTENNSVISRDTLISFFNDTRLLYQEGDAKFDIDDTCLWTFFFVDPSAEKLEPLASYLTTLGYDYKGILPPDPNAAHPLFFLRVDRAERHTVDSLDSRNVELHGLATRFGVEGYDGMDVGEIDNF
jgi:hypothetical protein